jgi:hypothetical protein
MRAKPSQNSQRLTLKAEAAARIDGHRNLHTVPLVTKEGIDSADMADTMAPKYCKAVTS